MSIQRCPMTVKENGSERGIAPVRRIRSPEARCHQRSLSVARVIARDRTRRNSDAAAAIAAVLAPPCGRSAGRVSSGSAPLSFPTSFSMPPARPLGFQRCDSVSGSSRASSPGGSDARTWLAGRAPLEGAVRRRLPVAALSEPGYRAPDPDFDRPRRRHSSPGRLPAAAPRPARRDGARGVRDRHRRVHPPRRIPRARPARQRIEAGATDLWRRMGGCIRAQVIVRACVALILTRGLSFVRFEAPLLIGVLAGALNFVPYLGSTVSLLLALLLALNSSVFTFVGVLAVFAVEQFLEGNFLVPYFIGRQVELHPLAVLARSEERRVGKE